MSEQEAVATQGELLPCIVHRPLVVIVLPDMCHDEMFTEIRQAVDTMAEETGNFFLVLPYGCEVHFCTGEGLEKLELEGIPLERGIEMIVEMAKKRNAQPFQQEYFAMLDEGKANV